MNYRIFPKNIVLAASFLFVAWVASPMTYAADQDMASSMLGTWVGTSDGYEGDHVATGFEKIVISEVNGRAALGTWQYRKKSDEPWSAPIRATFTVFPNDASGYVVAGADSGGIYTGELSAEGELTLGYMQTTRQPMVLQFRLSKQ